MLLDCMEIQEAFKEEATQKRENWAFEPASETQNQKNKLF